MYSEFVNVAYRVGLHGEVFNAFAQHFPPGIAFINGIDVTDPRAFALLAGQKQVQLGANSGDPVTDKNIVDIMHGIANFGHDPWRGMGRFPAHLYQQAADWIRSQPEYGLQTMLSAPVSGEMTTSKLAMWSVVALGELQQPGGVGGTQQYNPVLDGPNPEGPNFEDNAENSQEQEMALQTWVNYALDMLERGDKPEVVLAKLAHDGCPDPEAILKWALEQPEKDIMDAPVTDEIGQDPFQAPIADDQQSGQMQDVFRQPPVAQAKRVRVVNSTMTGVEIDRWEDMWGQGIVKIALDEGGTINVSPDAIEELTPETPEHPVSQIQQFIDSLPKVEPSRPHIQARIDNLELVRRAVRSIISKVGFHDQVKLNNIDRAAQSEIQALKDSLGVIVSESDMAYLSGQQAYRPHGINYPNIEQGVVVNEDFNKKIAEKARIFVEELDDNMVTDQEAVAYAAAKFAYDNNAHVPEFVRLVEENREHRARKLASSDYEGPIFKWYWHPKSNIFEVWDTQEGHWDRIMKNPKLRKNTYQNLEYYKEFITGEGWIDPITNQSDATAYDEEPHEDWHRPEDLLKAEELAKQEIDKLRPLTQERLIDNEGPAEGLYL